MKKRRIEPIKAMTVPAMALCVICSLKNIFDKGNKKRGDRRFFYFSMWS